MTDCLDYWQTKENVLLVKESLSYPFTCFFLEQKQGNCLEKPFFFHWNLRWNGKPWKKTIQCLIKKQTIISKCHNNFYKSLENVSRGAFKTEWNIYDRAFFAKIDIGWKPLTIFANKLHHRCLAGFLIHLWYLVQ